MLAVIPQGGGSVCRPQRIGEECMLDVGQRQFLVLLFVAQAEGDSPGCLIIDRLSKRPLHLPIHMSAECDTLLERRSRERRPQLLLGNLLAQGNVVAVEQPMKLFAERL